VKIFFAGRDRDSGLLEELCFQFPAGAQFGATGTGVLLNFSLRRDNWAPRKYLHRFSCPAGARVARRALALAGQSPQLLLDDAIFEGVKTDSDKTAIHL
jgi:hypothetical protein